VAILSFVLLATDGGAVQGFQIEDVRRQQRRHDGCRGVWNNEATRTMMAASSLAEQVSRPSPTEAMISSCHKVLLPAKANSSRLWNALVPPVWNSGTIGFDATVEWSVGDDIEQVAANLVCRCCVQNNGKGDDNDDGKLHAERIRQLQQAMQSFQDHCTIHLRDCEAFKARLVASRGPCGTKCPQWHVDHVPVRWIQSLVGRGCQYIESDDGVNWAMINGLEDEDENNLMTMTQADRNDALVDADVASIVQAQEADAMVLAGNSWPEFCKQGHLKFLSPVVHKSPAPIPFWEPRVLLTQDVVITSK